MFRECICLLLVFLKITVCTFDAQTAEVLPLPHSLNIKNRKLFLNENKFHVRPDRSKRGIVLIDEDFDVPPNLGSVKVRKDGEHDSKSAQTVFGMFSEDEGSGSETIMSEEPAITKFARSAATRNIKASNLVEHGAAVSAGEFTSESSGDGDILTSEKTPDYSQFTIDRIIVSTSTKHSGDVSPSTEAALTSEDANKGVLPTQVTDETQRRVTRDFDDLCLNVVCASNDLIIMPSPSKIMSEGTNLTLQCSPSNATDQGLLKWYKYNESNYLSLRELNDGFNVSFLITNTMVEHSGTYFCLKYTETSCCHRRLEITIYKNPDYKKHLVVIGGIAAGSLLICILIGICKCVKTKRYEEKSELRNVEKPFLL